MSWFRRTVRGARRSDERGAAAVEFAIIMPLLAVLLMGIIEYGYFFYVLQASNSAARETARQLSVGNCQGSTGSTLNAETFAESQASIPLTLTYGTPSNQDNTLPGVGETLEVRVTANAEILNFIPVPNGGVITRSVQTYVEDDTAGTCP
jgi:Flp pilus assembly protein TadG